MVQQCIKYCECVCVCEREREGERERHQSDQMVYVKKKVNVVTDPFGPVSLECSDSDSGGPIL